MSKSDDKQADFFNIVAYRKTAENLEKYGSKGRLIALKGSLNQNTWEDQQKVKHSTVEIVVESFELLDSSQGARTGEAALAPGTNGPNIPMDIDDKDDLPF